MDGEITLQSEVSDYFRDEDDEDAVEESMAEWSECLDEVGANWNEVSDCEIQWTMTLEQAFRSSVEFGWFRGGGFYGNSVPENLAGLLEGRSYDPSKEDVAAVAKLWREYQMLHRVSKKPK